MSEIPKAKRKTLKIALLNEELHTLSKVLFAFLKCMELGMHSPPTSSDLFLTLLTICKEHLKVMNEWKSQENELMEKLSRLLLLYITMPS